MPAIITLTTDFGLSDPYVGIMKGVILSIAPETEIIDLTHGIPPQDIMAATLALESAFEFFPQGAIHVAVVDPGVGSRREAVAIETERCIFIGPNNGLFTAPLARYSAVRTIHLTNPTYHRQPVSATFHGRDIFAPAAAHLALGASIEDLGEPIKNIVLLDVRHPVPDGDTLELHVIRVDRFGNLVTDLTADRLIATPDQAQLCIKDTVIVGISRSYSDVEPGEPVAYFGSGGRLEIAIRNGSAAEALNMKTGDVLSLHVAQ